MGSPDGDKEADNDENAQHRVRITRPFYLGVHEVTRGQFRQFVGRDRLSDRGGEGGKAAWLERGNEGTPRKSPGPPGGIPASSRPTSTRSST